MRAARLLFAACLAMLLMAPAVAQADDASVYRASQCCVPQGLERELNRALAEFERTGRRARLLRALSAARKAVGRVSREVSAQQPSSENGRLAKVYTQRSLRDGSKALSAFGALLRARSRAAQGRAIRRADALFARADRYDRRATTYFRRAGVVP